MPSRKHPEPDSIDIEIAASIHDVAEAEWNALTEPSDPFTEHGFLAILEDSNSVGKAAGWVPVHVIARRSGQVVGAAPLYLKNNSYGEYIFDWGWARGAQDAGLPYYPKLVSAIPFTPATGRRLLTGPGELDPTIGNAMLDGMHAIAQASHAHSIHLLFTTEAEHALAAQRPEFVGRITHQFHWDNAGYTTFDQWLERFRSRRRKEVRRERRVALEGNVRIRVLRGSDLSEAQWTTLHDFYRDTIDRKLSQAYLTESFFTLAPERIGHRILAFIAEVDDQMVAGALTFQRGDNLYGRYWGCKPGWEHLHFELCYHRPIEACIEHGWQHFEAGAQGPHKIRRGLMPTRTWSAHHLRHPGLHRAVANSLVHEGAQIEREIAALRQIGPFRREDPAMGPG